jgi:AraC-like DNA-binding protein/quercetin dioxygenase-like cupin family protein
MNKAMLSNLLIKDKSDNDKTIKVSSFRKEVKKTAPHKHNNYFEVIYLSDGSGYHIIDNIKYMINPPVIFFIRREQVHNFELNEDCNPTGFVAIIKKKFIDQSMDGELKNLFTSASNHSCLYPQRADTIQTLFELLTNEESKGNFHVIEGLLKALLAKILEVSKPVIAVNQKLKTDFYQSYVELLSTNRPIKNQVAHYAALLNTTPQNLNAVCRKAVDESAANILGDYIIGEAKRLLIYTKNTVSEISFALDFNDASHFIKFFKRFTGMTPQSFRLMP